MAAAPRQPNDGCQRRTGLSDQVANFSDAQTGNPAGEGAIGTFARSRFFRNQTKTDNYMNTLILRTRFANEGSQSSVRRSSWKPHGSRSKARRQARPVFISSPTPKAGHSRVQPP